MCPLALWISLWRQPPAVGDSVAHILEEMGLEKCGGHGTTAALALLNDAVKKGGTMASSHVGGLSGAFIPVTEDAGMIDAARCGALSIEKLEAMTAVCSVGLDMIAIPGDTPAEVISAIIADEAAIGMVNSKTTAVRVIPAIGKQVGGGAFLRRPVGRRPGHGAENHLARKIYCARRANPRAVAEPEKLTQSEKRDTPALFA